MNIDFNMVLHFINVDINVDIFVYDIVSINSKVGLGHKWVQEVIWCTLLVEPP